MRLEGELARVGKFEGTLNPANNPLYYCTELTVPEVIQLLI